MHCHCQIIWTEKKEQRSRTILSYVKKHDMTHSDVGVNLLFQASNLSKVLPDSLLKVQNAAALLLRVAGNFQLEAHALFFLTVLLQQNQKNQTIKKKHTENPNSSL